MRTITTYGVWEGQKYIGTFEDLADVKNAMSNRDWPFDRLWGTEPAVVVDDKGVPVHVYLGRGKSGQLNQATLYIVFFTDQR